MNRIPTLSRFALAASAASFVLGPASEALAQPSADDKAIAESLFEDARKLLDQGKIPDACRKLEESQRIDPAPGTLLNLAVCHEKEGKIASAWSEFKESLAAARRSNRADRETLSKERIAAIEPQLPKLVITVPKDVLVPDLQVVRGGATLGAAIWGSEIPVNPGTDVIEVRAPGKKSWTTKVEFARGKVTQVTVPALENAPVAVAPPPGSAGPSAAPAPAPAPFWTPMRTTGAVVGGVGVVAAGVGGFFGLSAMSKHNQSNDACPTDVTCTQAGADANDQARKYARLADLTIGVGAAAIVTGVVLIAIGGPVSAESPPAAEAPKKSSAFQPTVALTGGVLPGGAAAGFVGTW